MLDLWLFPMMAETGVIVWAVYLRLRGEEPEDVGKSPLELAQEMERRELAQEIRAQRKASRLQKVNTGN